MYIDISYVIRDCCTLSRVVWDYSSNSLGGGNDTSKAKYWSLLNNNMIMQWKPIANKYRKGTMKSTLHSTHVALIAARRFVSIYMTVQAPKGVKERVKSPYSEYTHIFILRVRMPYRCYIMTTDLCTDA